MIDRLVAALRETELELDWRDIADVLWLADVRARDAASEPPTDGLPGPAGATAKPRGADGPAESDAADASPVPAEPAGPQEVTPVGSAGWRLTEWGDADHSGGAGLGAAAPTSYALPGGMEIGRALRPMKQQRRTPRRKVFDPEATVDLFCDTGVLVPVLRAGLERWFDVAVVADASATMAVWDDTVAALADLLERHGAYRGVTRWALAERDGAIEVLSPSGLAHRPHELLDLAGRRLVLVVTDAVDALWARAPVWEALRAWGEYGPVALVQVLPPRSWPQTRLGEADAAVAASRPGQPNRQLEVVPPWWWLDGEPPDHVVPLVGLDEASLSPWARMVMGAPGVSVPGVLAVPEDGTDGGAFSQAGLPGEVDLDRLGNVLRSTVSAQAYRLAVLLSAVEVSLPIARIVMHELMPQARLAHLAELIAAGVLEATRLPAPGVAPDAGGAGAPLPAAAPGGLADRSKVALTFAPGLRELLQRSLTVTMTLQVWRAVAPYLEAAHGLRRFSLLLQPPHADDDAAAGAAELREGLQAIAADLADRLGLKPSPASGPEKAPTAMPEPTRPEGEDAETAARPEAPEVTESPGTGIVDCTTDPAHEALFSALAREIEVLNGSGGLAIAEFSATGIVTWTIRRDHAGTPRATHHTSGPWTRLREEGRLTSEGLDLTLPASREYRTLLICTTPGSPDAAEAMEFARARYRGTLAINCTALLDDAIREAISRSPLTRSYELAVLNRDPSGRTLLSGLPLFLRGAKPGDREMLRVQCMPSDENGTAFAVYARGEAAQPIPAVYVGGEPSQPIRQEQLNLVWKKSAAVEPGTYDLTVELLRPGAIQIEGLPASLHTDSRTWPEILAAVPARLDPPGPVHLIVAIEVSDLAQLVARRFERASQLIAIADTLGEPTLVSLITYGAHSFDGRIPSEAPSVLFWAASSAIARRLLTRDRRVPSAGRYSRAAQLECALAQIARELPDLEGRPVLVTIGSRPAYPAHSEQSETLPCPNQNDWRAALSRLRDHPGISFGTIRDGDSDAEIWNYLGSDAHSRLETINVERFAADLGLVSRSPEIVPLPLAVPAHAVAAERTGPDVTVFERPASDSGRTGAVQVSEADPRRLGVHAAISVPGGPDEALPEYVPRDADAAESGVRASVAAAAQRGGFVLLVGGSSVGKTRSAVEAVKALLPDWWLVHPAGPDEVAALAQEPPQRTVVWLDELQRYLDGERGLTSGVVRALLSAPDPVVIIGTLWPDRYTNYITMPAPGGADPHAREREVLDLAMVVRISPELSPAEQERVRTAAVRDPRLQVALESAGYGLTQTLAAAPQLVARWEEARTASPYAWAVLTAALDAARLGAHAPLSTNFLRAAAPGYCTSQQQAEAPDDWFEEALAYATGKLHGAAAALSPVGTGMGQIVGYAAPDYLIQHASRERRSAHIPASTWDAFISYVRDPADTARLGDSASDRLLYHYAVPLYRHAANAGDGKAALRLADLLAERGDLDGATQLLRAGADGGDQAAALRLADLLAERGDLDGLRARADAGDQAAASRLLAEHGDLDGLRARADGGDWAAALRLADLLAERGDLDGATQLLRAGADGGDQAAALRLADLLAERGDLDGLRARADAGDQAAASRLLAEHGDLDGLRARADGGDWAAALRLADLLAEQLLEQGRGEEAARLRRFGLNPDGSIAQA